jgi:hypothetical protein
MLAGRIQLGSQVKKVKNAGKHSDKTGYALDPGCIASGQGREDPDIPATLAHNVEWSTWAFEHVNEGIGG